MRNLRPVPDIPPRAVLYLRQSEYREESVSFDIQEAAGRDYCARQGYDVVGVLADRSTGKVWRNRPDVQQAIQMIEDRQADVIVLWKWSRLSRNRAHWALASDRVDLAGGRIESATEPIDTGTASGRFARGVMTEYAAFQSEQIGEVWEEVRQRRLRQGLPASGRLPYGWVWNEDGTISPNPEHAPIVVDMYRRYLAGQGSAQIARWLNSEGIPGPNGNIWNRVRPFTVLDSPIHAGLIPYRGEEHPGAHDGIISPETWHEYKTMRTSRRGTKPRERSPYVLSGLIRCGCGQRMQGKGAVTGGYLYTGYICTNMSPDHGRNYISSRKLDPVVTQWVHDLADHIDQERNSVPRIEHAGTIERLTAEWNAHQARLDRLTRLLVDGTVSEPSYRVTRAQIEAEQADVQRRLDDARAHATRTPDAALLARLTDDWDAAPDDLRRELLATVLDHVTVTPGHTAAFHTRWGDSSVLSVE